MTAHAQHADVGTGRGCTPTVARLQRLARCSERTIQRARAAARELGIAREVFRGRHLRLDERMEAYERGSQQRGWASVYALGCPSWLARHLPRITRYPQLKTDAVGASVDCGTPPVGRSTKPRNPRFRHSSSAQSAEQRAPRAASTRPPGQRRTRHRWNPAGFDLAVALQQRIRTFQRVHPGRLAPVLTRFATAAQPWTAAQLQASIERVLRAHGWTWLSRPQHTPGYLARLLREIDHTDQPEVAARKQLRTVQAGEAEELAGHNLCPHGVAGADHNGRAARCAFCRCQSQG